MNCRLSAVLVGTIHYDHGMARMRSNNNKALSPIRQYGGICTDAFAAVVCLSFMSSAFAQSSNMFTWRAESVGIGEFTAFALQSGVKPLVGDFNGDDIDDIALLRQQPGWTSVPVAMSNGTAPWTITHPPVSDFATWAASSAVEPLIGDFNGDGMDDIALVRQEPGWNKMPVAFANGQGGWTFFNKGVGNFAEWAAVSGVKPLVGDFNGDGNDDIALVRQEPGWNTMPVALANGRGGWTFSYEGAGNFAEWTGGSNVSHLCGWKESPKSKPLIGDFDGDGNDDIALAPLNGGLTVPIPIAKADGNGGWKLDRTYTDGGLCFPGTGWRANVNPMVGEFNGDGIEDIVMIPQENIGQIPIAFSGSHYLQVTQLIDIQEFIKKAASKNVLHYVSDFNGDGLGDIALYENYSQLNAVPVAFANGNGGWKPAARVDVDNYSLPIFRVPTGVEYDLFSDMPDFSRPTIGDFNGDGSYDLASIYGQLVIGAAANGLPVTFAKPPGVIQKVSISRHKSVGFLDTMAAKILWDASNLLRYDDGKNDIVCSVILEPDGDIAVFEDLNGDIGTEQHLNEILALPGHVKIIENVDYCGKFNTSLIGCAYTPGTSIVVEASVNEPAILWAHEFGHNQGLRHRDNLKQNIMNSTVRRGGNKINKKECIAFKGTQHRSPATQKTEEPATATLAQMQVAGQGATPLPVEDFVSREYFSHGLPLADAANYEEADVDILLKMLNDPGQVKNHEKIALTLGMIGSTRAVDPLISYIRNGIQPGAGDIPRLEYKGLVGATLALGYLANLNGSETALMFLLESTSPDFGMQGSPTSSPESAALRRKLARYAITALGFSANTNAVTYLQSLLNEKGGQTKEMKSFVNEFDDIIRHSLELNDEVTRDGLVNYYK